MIESNWVNFKAVKAAVTMEMVLERYQVNWLRQSNDELRGRCPIHKGEGQDTFHANLNKNAFQCFSCKAHGNVLDFVAAMEQCSIRQAAEKLQEWFLGSEGMIANRPSQAAQGVRQSRGEAGEKNAPLSFELKGVDHTHPYLATRGISRETAESFGVGFFAGRGSMHGRIVIPIHNETGLLVAYAGRSLEDGEEKYKLPSGFHKSHVVYNLHRVKEQQAVVLVEGFFGCMKVMQAGFAAAALMGSSLAPKQEELLGSTFARIRLLFDGDDAGTRVTEECLSKLGRKVWVNALTLKDGQQPDKLSEEELTRLLEEK
jgi:DNA primase